MFHSWKDIEKKTWVKLIQLRAEFCLVLWKVQNLTAVQIKNIGLTVN